MHVPLSTCEITSEDLLTVFLWPKAYITFQMGTLSFWSYLFKVVHSILYTLAEQGMYTQLYKWSMQLYAIPEQNIAARCQTLSFTLQCNLMSSHDFRALLSHSHLPFSVLTLCKYAKKAELHSSSLIDFHIDGVKLPVGLRLHWLFIAYDILSFCSQLSDLAGHKHLNSLCRPNCKKSEVQNRYFTTTNPQLGITAPVGGGRPYVFSSEAIVPYLINQNNNVDSSVRFLFIDHVDHEGLASFSTEQYVVANVPLFNIIPHISIHVIHKIA